LAVAEVATSASCNECLPSTATKTPKVRQRSVLASTTRTASPKSHHGHSKLLQPTVVLRHWYARDSEAAVKETRNLKDFPQQDCQGTAVGQLQ